MTSKNMRTNPFFLRNYFETAGKWELPIIKKQSIPLNHIELLAYSDTRSNASDTDKKKGVHFFVDDYRFNGIYNNPNHSLKKLSQYAFLCTPDFSTYTEMNYWRQLESVAHSRWVGAYWQSNGLTVVPTITWSDIRSFNFCFDGILTGSIVTVGTVGCKQSKKDYLYGYCAMIEHIQPSAVICFGKPYSEMKSDILICVDYRSSRKAVR